MAERRAVRDPGGSARRTPAALAFALFLAAVLGSPQAMAKEPPRVVTSVLPVHSLVASVMEGLGAPHLLIHGAASPHNAGLRPSDARALDAAHLVIWVGPGLETFLEKPLAALAGAARVIALGEAPDMRLLKLRADATFEPHGASHAMDTDHGVFNPHLWLDPQNAMTVARVTAAALGELDAANAATYRANAARLIAKLDDLDRELRDRLAPVAGVPYAVFHDAYAYLEAHYGLRAVGALTVNPALPPGARRLAALRRRLAETAAVCVFAEPQFRPALVAALVAGTGVRAGVLDPLGAGLAPGPEAYFTLMRALAQALVECLGSAG